MRHTVLKKEIEDVIAAWPAMPAFDLSKLANDNEHSSVATFSHQAKLAARDLSLWREETLALLDKVDVLLGKADGTHHIHTLVATMNPARERIEAVIQRLEASLGADNEVYVALDALEDMASRSEHGVAKKIKETSRGLTRNNLQTLKTIRDRLMQVIWDHDPDARGGPKFDDADDLIAFLQT